MDLETLSKDIELIKERNMRVAAEKAWERSGVRVLAICILTYITASVILRYLAAPNFYVSALIPVAGFYLSTLSVSFIKRLWMNRHEG